MGGLRTSQWLILATIAVLAVAARGQIWRGLLALPGLVRASWRAARAGHQHVAARVSWLQIVALMVFAVLAVIASHPDGPRSW